MGSECNPCLFSLRPQTQVDVLRGVSYLAKGANAGKQPSTLLEGFETLLGKAVHLKR